MLFKKEVFNLSLATFVALISSANSFASRETRDLGVAANEIAPALMKVFSEGVENTGGFSKEITINELNCFFSTSAKGKLSVQCDALLDTEKQLGHREISPLLALNLINAIHPTLDQSSEPGTTYFTINGLSCGVLEPRSTPDRPAQPKKWCSLELRI